MNRVEELQAGYKKKILIISQRKRTCKITALIKTNAHPRDTYYVPVPALGPSQCNIPETLGLSYNFENSNTKSWFLNNLGRLLTEKLLILIGGKVVYENTGESMLELYKDLWKSDEKRDNMAEYRLANENVRKRMSKDDNGNKTAKTNSVLDLTSVYLYERKKIPLGQILCDHGPYAPYGMSDFQYRITLPAPSSIMKAQSIESVGSYKSKDMQLEYKTIESKSLAREVRSSYEVRRSLAYDYSTLLKTLSWSKSSTREVIDINIPRRSLKAVILLFTKPVAKDSENCPFPNITRISVTVEGNSNDIYSDGLMKRKMYDKARRYFGSKDVKDNVSCREYYTNKFAMVIDFRTVDDDTVVGSGRRLMGTQSGILLEIEKDVMTENLNCHVMAVAHGLVNIVDKQTQSLEY